MDLSLSCVTKARKLTNQDRNGLFALRGHVTKSRSSVYKRMKPKNKTTKMTIK